MKLCSKTGPVDNFPMCLNASHAQWLWCYSSRDDILVPCLTRGYWVVLRISYKTKLSRTLDKIFPALIIFTIVNCSINSGCFLYRFVFIIVLAVGGIPEGGNSD